MDERPEKITFDHVRDGLLKVIRASKDAEKAILTLFKKYNARVLSEVDPEHYGQLLDDCQLEIQRLTGGHHD